MQCLRAYADTRASRHLANALKYCTSISVVVLSFLSSRGEAFATCWLVASAVSSAFAFGWDVVMDWGLRPWAFATSRPAARPFLYPPWCYYAAACTNGAARLTWALYISPGQRVVQQHVILVLGCVELLRRAQWALFRVEFEQHTRDARARAAEAALVERAALFRPAEAAPRHRSVDKL